MSKNSLSFFGMLFLPSISVFTIRETSHHNRLINTYDLETYLDENNFFEPYCVSMIVNNDIITLYHNGNNIIIESLNIITEKIKKDVEIYVHNLNFDGLIIIDHVCKSKINFKMFNDKTNIYWIKIDYSSIIITFRCSYKIIGLSLEKLGEIQKYEKTDFPYNFVNKKNLFYIGEIPDICYWRKKELWKYNSIWDLKKECMKYCERDVHILHKALLHIVGIIEKECPHILKKSYSLASISFKIFFQKYNYNSVAENISIKEDIYIRNSYYGGRCEVFGNIEEEEHIKYYDFSSMYAQCMMEKFHLGNGSFVVPNEITKPGFYCIEYKSDFQYPILPNRIDGKLMFANGTQVGTFWFEEIQYYIEEGGVVNKIINAITYDYYDYAFDAYVNEYLNLRKKGGYYDKFCKNLLNSFYGSTALNQRNTFTYITNSEEESSNIFKTLNIVYFYEINNTKIFIIDKDHKFKDSKIKTRAEPKRNVSIASAIASKARIKLHKTIKNVIEDGGRPLYCDTDSIFASYNNKDLRENVGNKKWLKIYKDGVFCAPKSYAVLDYEDNVEIKLKGISNKDTTIENIKKKFYSSEKINFSRQKFQSKKNFKISISNIDKNISFEKYDKRIFDTNKKNTTPVTLIDE